MPVMEHLIRVTWNSLKVDEPLRYDPADTRAAIFYLLKLTGMSHADLAARCGLSPTYFRAIEVRNGRIPEPVCVMLQNIANDYYLTKLAQWFKRREEVEISRKRASKRWGI